MACKTFDHAPALRAVLARTVLVAALAVGVGALTTLATPAPVAAQREGPGSLKDPGPHTRPMMISLFTGIPWGYYSSYGFPFSIGGRFLLPIVPDGFIPSVNDEFALEFGLDFNFVFISNDYGYWDESTIFGVMFPIEAMYDFHFTPMFDAYVKAGLQFGADFSDYLHDGFWVTAISVVGMRLWFSDSLAFRAEAGWPWIKAGIALAF